MGLPEKIGSTNNEQSPNEWESIDVEAEIKRITREIEREFDKIDPRYDSPANNKNLTLGPLPNSQPKTQGSIEIPHFKSEKISLDERINQPTKRFSPPSVPNSKHSSSTTNLEIPKIQHSTLHFTDEDFTKSEKSFSPIEKTKVHHHQQKEAKKETGNLSEKAREIKNRRKRVGQKVIAALLVATTVTTVASAKKGNKETYAAEPTNCNSIENIVDEPKQETPFSFNEETNEVTIRETSTTKEETTKEESTKTETTTENGTEASGPTAEIIQNPDDTVEMDMNVKLDLTDSMKKQLEEVKNIYEKHIETYKEIANTVKEETGLNILPETICAIHYRESGCDFSTYLHNGQKLGRTTTLVPKGIYFENFAPAAIDAIKREISQFKYNTKRFNLKNDLSTLSSIAMFTETFNGTGARDYHNAKSSYVYTGTNLYKGGMYTGDSQWNETAKDTRVGTLPIFLYLHQSQNETQNQ